MVRSFVLTAAVMLSNSLCAWGDSIEWIRQFGTSGQDSASSIAADDFGNIYVSGITYGNLAGPHAGSGDAYVRKYDAAGNVLWTRQFGTNAGDEAADVSADGLGNVYVSGYTSGTLQGMIAGETDLFVRKYDAAGNVAWTRQFGTDAMSDFFSGGSADPTGNVYVAGTTSGNLGGTNAGIIDAFVRKYDTTGNIQWTAQFGTDTYDGARGVSADDLGNVYVAGFTSGILDGSNSGGGMFVRKYDPIGNLQWTRQFGPDASDLATDVFADDLGNVYLAGYTFGNLGSANSGNADAFVRKYDAAGNLQWTRQVGTGSPDYGYGVVADGLGNVYLAGSTSGALAGNSDVLRDVFVTKFTSDGDFQWAHQLGTSSTETLRGIAAGSGRVYLSGATGGGLSGTNAGSTDAFLVAISAQVPEPPSVVLFSCMAAVLAQSVRRRVT